MGDPTELAPPEVASRVAEQAGLKRALLAGEPAALRAFHDACMRPLYSFCYHRLGRDHHSAEEVVQETLLLALERIAQFEPERGCLHTWLAYLARNSIRRANEHRRRFVKIDSGRVPASPELEDAGVETAALVGVALERLPARYRTVLERKYVRGESVHAIAAAEATSEKAVESLLGRAREAFRRVFTGLTSQAERWV